MSKPVFDSMGTQIKINDLVFSFDEKESGVVKELYDDNNCIKVWDGVQDRVWVAGVCTVAKTGTVGMEDAQVYQDNPLYDQETPDPEADHKASAWSSQEGGDHYKKGIQPAHYAMANGLNALQTKVVKYVTRYRDKDGLKDLYKCRHVLEMLIEWEEKGGDIKY